MTTQKKTVEEKVRILQELEIWESQGKPASSFAEAHGIGRKNLYNWKARRPQRKRSMNHTLIKKLPQITMLHISRK